MIKSDSNMTKTILIKVTKIFCLFISLSMGLSSCSNIKPWVKPYQRQNLADPLMDPARNELASAYLEHVYEAREGARGATSSGGGGCGCN